MKKAKNNFLRYGGYSALLTLMVIAIAIVVNIIVTDLNIKVDTTTEKLYSLSTNTEKVTKALTVPINIYILQETGKEELRLKEIINKYINLNNKITVTYKDPILYPTFANAYKKTSSSTIPNGSVIVENRNTGKYKVLTPADLYETTTTDDNVVLLEGLIVENALTNALGYVSTDIDGTVYYTSGHNELDLPIGFKDAVGYANLSLSELNLLTAQMPAPENSIVLVFSPHTDFTKEELKKLTDFLDQGGKAILFMDINMPELPNFNELLSYYSIAHDQGLLIETDANYSQSSYPTYLLPGMSKHDITNSLRESKTPVVIPLGSGIKHLNTLRNGVTLTPLLSSSDNSYLKKNINPSTYAYEEGDIPGPVILACAIEENNTLDASNPINTKLFVMSSSFFLDENMVNLDTTGNKELITNALGWLFSVDNSYAIQTKDIDTYNLRPISSSGFIIFGALTIVVIPGIILIFGITIWIKRRHL